MNNNIITISAIYLISLTYLTITNIIYKKTDRYTTSTTFGQASGQTINTSGQTDTLSGQTSTKSKHTNGKMSTTNGQRSTTSG